MASHPDAGNRGTNWLLGLLIGVLVGGIGVVVAADRFGTDSASPHDDPSLAASPTSSAAADPCPERTHVKAVVVPVVRPLVEEAAARACVDLDLVEAAGRDGVKAGLDADLWVTDSSLWSAARPTDPGAATSIASSPIVGLATQTTALLLGHGDSLSWPTLLSPDRAVRIGFHDPSTTATGLLAAWPLLQAQRLVSPVRFEALALTAKSLSDPAIIGDNVVNSPPQRMVVFTGEYVAEPSNQVRVLRGKQGEPYLDFPAYNTSRDSAVRPVVGDLSGGSRRHRSPACAPPPTSATPMGRPSSTPRCSGRHGSASTCPDPSTRSSCSGSAPRGPRRDASSCSWTSATPCERSRGTAGRSSTRSAQPP